MKADVIEKYTTWVVLDCHECGGSIAKQAHVFQVVLGDGSGIDGPFCSERCVKEHAEREIETTRRIRLHGAAEDMLKACKGLIGARQSTGNGVWVPDVAIRAIRAAVAKAEGR